MCLNILYDSANIPDAKFGYKVFFKEMQNKREILIPEHRIEFKLKKRRWLTAEQIPVMTGHPIRKYVTGFHVYLNKEWAIRQSDFYGMACHRVLIKDITDHGLQEFRLPDSYTVVCKQIYIMEEVSK